MTKDRKTVIAAMRSFAAVWDASEEVTVEQVLQVSRVAKYPDAQWPGGGEVR